MSELPIDPDATADLVGPFPRHQPRTRAPLRPGVLVAVAAGGFAGGVARHVATEAAPASARELPWATLGVNVAGAFGLAVLVVLALEVWRPVRYLRPAVGTGFFGAFTTWSAFMVQTEQLYARDRPVLATAYLLGSAAAGLAAAAAGLLLARRLSRYGRRARSAAA